MLRLPIGQFRELVDAANRHPGHYPARYIRGLPDGAPNAGPRNRIPSIAARHECWLSSGSWASPPAHHGLLTSSDMANITVEQSL